MDTLTAGLSNLTVSSSVDSKAVDQRLSTLYGDVTTDRVLPAKVDQALRDMIAAKHEKLVAVVRQYTNETIEQLREAALLAVLDTMEIDWERCFEGCSTQVAKDISAAEKAEKKLNAVSLVYGEVTFQSLGLAVSQNFKLKPGGVFYDVGSGSGRGVFSAMFLHDFRKVRGVEILEGLYKASVARVDVFQQRVRPLLVEDEKKKGRTAVEQDIAFICNDFRLFDWTDADFVFANSTCFDEGLMRDMSTLSELLQQGSYFISLTKKLTSDHWECVESKQYRMSWGYATVHSQVKIKPARAMTDDERALRAPETKQE